MFKTGITFMRREGCTGTEWVGVWREEKGRQEFLGFLMTFHIKTRKELPKRAGNRGIEFSFLQKFVFSFSFSLFYVCKTGQGNIVGKNPETIADINPRSKKKKKRNLLKTSKRISAFRKKQETFTSRHVQYCERKKISYNKVEPYRTQHSRAFP